MFKTLLVSSLYRCSSLDILMFFCFCFFVCFICFSFLKTDIFLSLVPKQDRDNYRIMRNISVALNRAGIKLIMELNSEILTRILEHILEVSQKFYSLILS
jgi:hypothetical protein